MATTPSPDKKRKADEIGDNSGEEPTKKQRVDTEMSVDGTSDDKPKKKHRRRLEHRPPADAFILELKGMPQATLEEIIAQVNGAENREDYPEAKAALLPVESVRLLPTEKEKRDERKKYRRDYNKKPENIEKRRLKAQSPEEIEKRKAANADPTIQERKKICASGRRKTLRDIKEKYPELYAEVHAKHVPELPAEKKKKGGKSKKSKESSPSTDSTSSSSTTNSSTMSD